MKLKSTLYMGVAMAIAFAGGAATMAQVHDWHKVELIHQHVQSAIEDLTEVQQANGFHMGGHAEKAKEHLVIAERELHAAVDYARGDGR